MTKTPPAPMENRSHKGTGDDKSASADIAKSQKREGNPGQQGRQGNIKQNTTNQGYQQDR
jgi:predicted kinase